MSPANGSLQSAEISKTACEPLHPPSRVTLGPRANQTPAPTALVWLSSVPLPPSLGELGVTEKVVTFWPPLWSPESS